MKKIMLGTFLVLAGIFSIWAMKYVNQSGVFDAYPSVISFDNKWENSRVQFQMLDNEEKAVYTALYEGVMNCEEFIELPYFISGEMYTKIYSIFEKQETDFFYLNSDFYTSEKLRTAQIIYIDEYPKNKIEALENQKNIILDKIKGLDDYQKLLYIHDYLINNCKYEVEGSKYSWSAYGCLVEKTANCEGYAKAFKSLVDELGISCNLVVGVTSDGENHAWNQVELNGNWYNVDVTWDDADDQFPISHSYFLRSDDDFLKTHIADTSNIYSFSCKSKENEYYYKNNFVVSSQSDAERILYEKIESKSNFIEVKMSNSQIYEQFLKLYIDEQRLFDIYWECNNAVSIPSIKVKEIFDELIIEIQIG